MAESKTTVKTTKKKSGPQASTVKKAKKLKAAAAKSAAKVTLRASKKKKPAKEAARKKFKPEKHAPQAARATAPKGPVKAEASKTKFAPKVNAERNWLLIDADGKTVGRLATEIAKILRGKNKASFTPNNDVGDFVVVVNAEKVVFTKNKEENKNYYDYSGYIGGMKVTPAPVMRIKKPEQILIRAVKGMVPRNPLGRAQMKKLNVYAGPNHPHSAQNPQVYSVA